MGDIGERIASCVRDSAQSTVTLTFAQSLDGCLCAQQGESLAISCPESLQMTHTLRAAHAAIAVGIGTVLSDNPSLTTRLARGADPQPVVFDSRLRIPKTCKLFTDERCKLKPLVLAAKEMFDMDIKKDLEESGARIVSVENRDGHIDLCEAIDFLRKEFASVMIEGGAAVISSILSSKQCCQRIDRVVLTIAPMFLGGFNAIQDLIPEQVRRFWKVKEQSLEGTDIIVWLVPA